MTDAPDLKFRAFLSYAHADKSWATWLHRRLEGFALDADLAARATRPGPNPRRLAPIFLDRGNFSGGTTLTEATIAALDASAALIVLCSPKSAASGPVNEEVRLFRHRHPGRPVIPVLIDGRAPDNFPPALRFALSPDGTVTDTPITVLGPDLRDTGDGRELGLAKLVAGLLGLADANDVYRRELRRQRQAARMRALAAAVFLAVASAGGFFYWRSLDLGTTVVAQQGIIDKAAERAARLAQKLAGEAPAAAATPGTQENLLAALTRLEQRAEGGDVDAAKVAQLLSEGKKAEAVALLADGAAAQARQAAQTLKTAAKAYREAAAIAAVAEPGKARGLYAEAARLDPDDVEGLFQHAWFQREVRRAGGSGTRLRPRACPWQGRHA